MVRNTNETRLTELVTRIDMGFNFTILSTFVCLKCSIINKKSCIFIVEI